MKTDTNNPFANAMPHTFREFTVWGRKTADDFEELIANSFALPNGEICLIQSVQMAEKVASDAIARGWIGVRIQAL